MILSAEETLLGRGYPEDQVHKELYWPKGKEPRGATGAARRRRKRGRVGAGRSACAPPDRPPSYGLVVNDQCVASRRLPEPSWIPDDA